MASGRDARAYPILIMNWHEVVNDVVDGHAIAVTFCPLCGSSIAYSRTVSGQTLTFGVSGKLYKSNLVLYDRATGSLWSQVGGEAILAPFHSQRLEASPPRP